MKLLKDVYFIIGLVGAIIALILKANELSKEVVVPAFAISHVFLVVWGHKYLTGIINNHSKKPGHGGEPLHSEKKKKRFRFVRAVNILALGIWIVIWTFSPFNNSNKGSSETAELQKKDTSQRQPKDTSQSKLEDTTKLSPQVKKSRSDSINNVRQQPVKRKNEGGKTAFEEPSFPIGYIKIGTFDSTLMEWITPVFNHETLEKLISGRSVIGNQSLIDEVLMHKAKPQSFNDEMKHSPNEVRLLRAGNGVKISGKVIPIKNQSQTQYWIQVEYPKS